ncbi:GNAT family N-acetyltransferase [Microbacterium sp. XT11]|uniref:GNAT family N-acetyltransferase n=1 Tax=Microbacterium sp. XT11 TaxID=367477 RepID=UPI000742DCC7|nr:GNAT family N-acetyltransferase [Microbacterium sp. XT11]ALX66718.1 hypothetical protein AB663_002068 [Microbacterium sp. XT11]
MTAIDARDIPADSRSAERLRSDGLDYRVVDADDEQAMSAFLRAVDRGFLGPEPTDEALTQVRGVFAARRNIAVDDPASHGDLPIATTNSWVTPLTVPGGAQLDMWAISVVTVAATHRRRGIARALLEGELRSAASAGLPMAGLTVSEATIYGRYGFGSAVPVASFTVDTRRAGWAGFVPPGRVEYVDRELLADELGAVHDRVLRSASGRVPGWRGRWEGHAGVAPHVPNRDSVRGVRYLDAHGDVRGAMAYALSEKEGTFRFRMDIRLMVTETPDAAAALWRFALNHDLVDTVTADLRPIDDPLPWLVADPRGVTTVEHDHGWLRILDVPAAMRARTYSAPLDVVLRVDDPLGFTAGDWLLQVDSAGEARVTRATDREPDASLSVSVLSSLYAGAVRARTLHGAGRLVTDSGTADALDRAFIAFPAPTLDIWY